jgi:hypothetical protein
MNPYDDPDWDRPPTVGEMIQEITEYHVNNLSWADIKSILDEYYARSLASMPPEALQDAYDSIFNR